MTRIELQGAHNVRDLGGHLTRDGRKVARGRLLRGDALNRLEDADVSVLSDLGLRTVIDFRGKAEVERSGEDRLPDGTALVALPIGGGDINSVLSAAGGDISAQESTLGDGKAAAMMVEVNRQFITVPDFRAQFAQALRLIAAGTNAPVLFHCAAGKDRTGWMAAIVLTVLGVPREAILADYLLTNEYIWPAYQGMLQQAADAGKMVDPELMKPLLYQDPAYLEAAFDQVEQSFGSFTDFLSAGLGFGDADQQRLRDVLLD